MKLRERLSQGGLEAFDEWCPQSQCRIEAPLPPTPLDNGSGAEDN